MSKEYLNKLAKLSEELKLENEFSQPIEIKHFFNGASFYANGAICASWSPVGIAFKLSEPEVEKLISSGKATPLKYFPHGNVKKGYALFEITDDDNPEKWKKYFIKAVEQL